MVAAVGRMLLRKVILRNHPTKTTIPIPDEMILTIFTDDLRKKRLRTFEFVFKFLFLRNGEWEALI